MKRIIHFFDDLLFKGTQFEDGRIKNLPKINGKQDPNGKIDKIR